MTNKYSEATEKIDRDEMNRVLRLQGGTGEKLVNTIAYQLRQEGVREGEISLRNMTNNVLQMRFGRVPVHVTEKLNTLKGLSVLEQVSIQAAVCHTLTEFTDWLTAFNPAENN